MRAKTSIELKEGAICFEASGCGAQGQNKYKFSLDLYSDVDPEIACRTLAREVLLTVQKVQRVWWPRLTKQKRKPVFLRADFDRWLDESDAEREEQLKDEENINKLLIESRKQSKPLDNIKRCYLFLYNLVQFLFFLHVFGSLSKSFLLNNGLTPGLLESTGQTIRLCQLLAFLEILHSAVGFVRSPILPTLFQVLGRAFVFFLVIDGQEELQNPWSALVVYYIWSAIEIFRYPFYMLGSVGFSWRPLTWARYTLWIPLYPLGVIAEGVCIWLAIPSFAQVDTYSVHLIGANLDFVYVLYAWLGLLPFGLAVNFRHLWKQRRHRLCGRKRKMP
uniref:Very-long-chain (3R)-3-hydroxyacyl-CoA dehydratase n=1 Tax=Eptatretus burgeri TaxID=7764 RepID=A0A8C4Q3F8_EPTBU